MKNKPTIQRGELDWWAFRYVAGELSEAESEQFEARLDQDQGAREAVASAVELVQTISAAEHLGDLPVVAAAAREAHWWRRVAWASIVIGVGACVAIVAFMANLNHEGEAPLADGRPTQAAPNVAEAPLAAAWLEAVDEGAFATEPVVEDRIDFDAIVAADAAPAAAPDWMVSALAGMSGVEVDGGSPVEREN